MEWLAVRRGVRRIGGEQLFKGVVLGGLGRGLVVPLGDAFGGFFLLQCFLRPGTGARGRSRRSTGRAGGLFPFPDGLHQHHQRDAGQKAGRDQLEDDKAGEQAHLHMGYHAQEEHQIDARLDVQGIDCRTGHFPAAKIEQKSEITQKIQCRPKVEGHGMGKKQKQRNDAGRKTGPAHHIDLAQGNGVLENKTPQHQQRADGTVKKAGEAA